MKKSIILLTLAGLFFTASAQQQLVTASGKMPTKLNKNKKELVQPQHLNTRAEEGQVVFGYCQGFGDGLGPGAGGVVMEAAIEITEEMAQNWKGNKVVGMRIGFGSSSNNKVMLYLTESLTGEPFLMQPDMIITEQLGWNTFMFDTPYEIDGTAFFAGYQSVVNLDNDFPVGVDLIRTEVEQGSYIGLDNEFYPYNEMFGSVCVQIIIEGSNNLPQNEGYLSGLEMMPYVKSGEPFVVYYFVTNTGVQPINDVKVELTVDGQPVEGGLINMYTTDVASGESVSIMMENLVYDGIGFDLPIELKLTEINGQPNENTNAVITGVITFCQETYDRNPIIEEFTGTWCGYCPRGIVGMEYMRENYPDFIGVGVHYNDQMQSSSYVQVSNTFSGGSYPSAVIDRTYYFDPSAETMEEYYQYQKDFGSYAQIEIEALYSEEDDNIKVSSSSVFGIDIPEGSFSVAFGLVEDGVGPYMQENYFGGSSQNILEGWNNLPSRVRWTFNEVGREIVSPFGISESIPTNIKMGENYTYSTTMSREFADDLNNCYVVGYLLNNTTFEVLNSFKCSIANAEAGVESLLAQPGEQLFKVFNLQGVKVLETKDADQVRNLPKGLYILNGKKIAKTN